MCAEDSTCKSVVYNSGRDLCERYTIDPSDKDQGIKLDGQGVVDL